MSDIESRFVDAVVEAHEEELLNTPVPKIEKETEFMTNDKEKRYIIQTQSRSMQNLIESLGINPGGTVVQGTPDEKWYSVPKDYVSIRKPRKGRLDFAKESEKGVKARRKKNKS